MGSWREDIYGNDIAQDTLVYLEKAYKRYNSVDSAIAEVKNKNLYNYPESKLVVADFELDIKGVVSNFKSVSTVLKEELSSSVLDTWNEPNLRKVYLENFRYKLESNKTVNRLKNKGTYNPDIVIKWLSDKRRLDVL